MAVRSLGRNKEQPTGGSVTADAGFASDIANDDHIHPFWEAWNPLVYTSPWAHGAGSFPSRYCKTAELLYLQIIAVNTTSNQPTIAVLPVGFRPRVSTYFQGRANVGGTTYTVIYSVDTAGNIVAQDLTTAIIQQSAGIRANAFIRLDNG